MTDVPHFETMCFQIVGRNGHVALLTLNRPAVLNAINMQMLREWKKVTEFVESCDQIRVVVFTNGTSKDFCVGADLKELMNDAYSFADAIVRWTDVHSLTKPSIAAVKGMAIGGGCELALMSDILYVGTSATFSMPEVSHKTIPGAGGTQMLTAAIGKTRACEMIFSGCQISAVDAEKWGMASRIFPDDVLLDEALKLADKIASYSPAVVRKAKKAIRCFVDDSLAGGLAVERELFMSTFKSGKRKDVIDKFNEIQAQKEQNKS